MDIIETLYLFGGELLFGFIILLLRLFGKNKTAEALQAKKAKKASKFQKKAIKYTDKADKLLQVDNKEEKGG